MASAMTCMGDRLSRTLYVSRLGRRCGGFGSSNKSADLQLVHGVNFGGFPLFQPVHLSTYGERTTQ